MTGEKKRNLKSLTRFRSANKLNNYIKGEKKKKKKNKIKSKRIYRTNQSIRIINVLLESLL